MTKRDGSRKRTLPRWALFVVAGALFLATTALLVAHVFKVDTVQVDTVALGLLGALILTTALPFVGKIKWQDIELVINPEEIDRLEQQAASIRDTSPASPSDKAAPVTAPKSGEPLGIQLDELVRRDPTLALAKLRIELEQALRFLASSVVADHSGIERLTTAGLVTKLRDAGGLSPHLASLALTTSQIASRALHGEWINPEDAARTVTVGSDLVATIKNLFLDRMVQPVSSTEISGEERDRFLNLRYHVTTIVPLVDKPIQNEYLFTQEQFDNFLEGYEEYAEFLIGVKPENSSSNDKNGGSQPTSPRSKS